MKYTIPMLAFILVCIACRNNSFSSTNTEALSNNGLTLQSGSNPEWQYKNLRLYPIIAEAKVENPTVKNLMTLSEAMKAPGFRVLERKQFGRSSEQWYHGLTVQNKTQDTVLLMAGDVVTGGNQDRVMAYHNIVLPGTVKNVEVFCVEAGRSHYYDESASPAEKSVGAFKGYYNVASPQVRHAVQTSGNQDEVWAAVAKVTRANGAESSTKTYAALENATEQKSVRDAYLNFFEGKITSDPKIVGVVAVCSDRVLGVDIFGDSDLFRRQFPALLHGYVAEAAIAEKTSAINEADVNSAFNAVARLAATTAKPTEAAGRFSVGEYWVHLYRK